MAEPYLPPEMVAPRPAAPTRTNPKLEPNPFSDDDGSLPQQLREAKAVEPPHRTPAVVQALVTSRVLVPVLAHTHPGRTDDGGVVGHGAHATGEEDACETSTTPRVELPDGRHAFPVFTSWDAMRRWDATARPVPAFGVSAARTAISSGENLILVDPDDDPVLLPRPAVWALATEEEWVPAWRNPEVERAVVRALVGIEPIAAARVEVGHTTEIRVVVLIRRGLDALTMRDALTAASQQLGQDPVLREKVDTIELYPMAE